MKCKRLSAAILSLVMIISLLPTTALAAKIPAEYAPIFKWAGGLSERKINVELFFENESSPLGTTSSVGEGTICNINVPNGKEIYKSDASSGCSFAANKFTFWEVWDKSGDLKLYTRSTAGHTVTVNYEFADDPSKNHSESENVKYAEEKSFGSLDKKDYGYEITVSSGDAKYEVNSLNVLRVTGGAEASVITVTYTPKDVIYIDQYYDNGKLWVKWTENNIKVNGPELLNGAAEAAVIEGENLTDAVENYRFLTVDGVTYDFSFASLVPVKGSILQPITDVWYDRDEGTWYYSHTDRKGVLFGLGDKVPVVNRGCVNFCYNTPHTENSEHHDWKWVHVDGTEKENSQHQQVCKHCNKEGTIERCKFDLPTTETGTHTCKDCGYSYTDEITPTGTPVYVYFKTVNTKNELVKVESGVTYNANGSSWATLGKLVTATTVTPEKKNILGAEVKTSSNFVKHDSNKDFDLALINKWVELKQDNGAAGYGDAPTWAWHLNGQVNVYKLSYKANRPAGVGEEDVTGMPDSAYYLPNWNAPVSTDDPTLQGYVFGGWYKDSDCKIEAGDKVAVTEDTDLYAKWTPAQPTTGFGSVVITTTKPELKETVDLSGGAYEVPYTATYTMSDKLLEMLKAAPSGVPMTFVVKLDSRLTAKKGADGKFFYDFDGAGILEVDENKVMVSSDGHTITVVCNPVADWETAVNDKTSVVMTLKGIGVLAARDFDAGKYLNTTGHIKGTIPVGGTPLPVKISANVCRTKMTAQTYTVTYHGNGADSGRTADITAYTPGEVATVKANGYTCDDCTFTGWNTKADGSGISYAEGGSIKMLGNVVLYAQWTRNSSHGGDDGDDDDYFAIQKVDAQDGHALNGAKFELYQLDKNDRIVNRRVVETTRQGSKSGIALFSVDNKKSCDGIWYYAEVSAPEGYVLDRTEYEINHKDFSDSLSAAIENADTVRNYRGTTPDLLNDSDHFAYVIGYMDGNVRPYGLISRAETTTIFFRLLKDSVRDGNLLTSNTYTDVPDDYWANTAISTMTGLGIVQGRSTTTFDPKAPITRAQFAAICARFDTGKSNGEQTFSDIKGHWAKAYIERAAELGWISGFQDGTFRPDAYITRAQAVTMINRMLNRVPEDPSDLLPGMNVWPDCGPGDWFYLAIQEATNSHDYRHKAGSYETWTGLNADPDWTRYEN